MIYAFLLFCTGLVVMAVHFPFGAVIAALGAAWVALLLVMRFVLNARDAVHREMDKRPRND